MTTITAKAVQELRKITGCGMMDCKKALQEANGDLEQAQEVLKQKGQIKSAKKSSCITAEGLVVLAHNGDSSKAVLVEINCQTDFVAREASLVEFANEIAQQVLISDFATIVQQYESQRLELVATLGENITIRRAEVVTANSPGIVAAYLHTGGASVARIGALIALDAANEEIAKDIAMHVAAQQPAYLSEADIPSDIVAKETTSFEAQVEVQHAGKPKEMLDKIVAGKVAKYLKDLTLLGQSFVKDPSVTVANYLKTNNINVTGMCLLVVGAGIEKKQEDFASEVAAVQAAAQKS